MAQDHPGRWARDGPSLHRVRWWRPRTTRAKVGFAAVAAVSVTGLALALVAGLAGGPAKPAWIMTAGNVQSLSQQDARTAALFFNTPASYGAGASLVQTPVQARYATTRPGLHLLRPVQLRHPQRRYPLPLQLGHV
jgi:hypothetical protein